MPAAPARLRANDASLFFVYVEAEDFHTISMFRTFARAVTRCCQGDEIKEASVVIMFGFGYTAVKRFRPKLNNHESVR